MAYNILKGAVEGSVDQHADQEIGGIKVFKNTISASVFYDTDAQSPCATMKDVALTKVEGGAPSSLLTYEGETMARAHHNLSYEKNTLKAPMIVCEEIRGSGKGLHSLPADQFDSKIKASSLQISHGLVDIRGTLQAKGNNGIISTEGGLSVGLGANSGLSFRAKKLVVSPQNCDSINSEGQNLSDRDTFLVFDESRNATYSTTLLNLCDSYMRVKLPQPAGTPGNIQIKSRKGFQSSANFSYDIKENILEIGGATHTAQLKVTKALQSCGAVAMNIATVTDKKYHVQSDDYTVLADTSASPVTVTLPPACNHEGRILIIKKINSNRYKLNSHALKINVKEGLIDFQTQLTVKNNYATRTVQSDGENWWLIGKLGT